MNNRGWGLEAMILWCAVLGILLIVATVMINSSINNMYNNTNSSSSVIKKEDKTPTKEEDDNKKDNEEVYSSYLEKMTSASKLYIEREYNDSLEQIDNMYLTTTFLINNDYLLRLVDPSNNSLECIGYVEVKYTNNEVNYKPYLKCGSDYETTGYNSSHLE